jgi:hypothetical protein
VLVGVLADNPRRLAAILAVELASHALLALEVLVTLHAIGIDAGVTSAFIVEGGVKWIGTLFFFVPGQLGVSEGIYALCRPSAAWPRRVSRSRSSGARGHRDRGLASC